MSEETGGRKLKELDLELDCSDVFCGFFEPHMVCSALREVI